MRSFALIVALMLAGCSSGASTAPAVVAPVVPAPARAPWQTIAKLDPDPECAATVKRLDSGLALEEDLWFLPVCVVTTSTPESVAALAVAVRDFRTQHSERFVTVHRSKAAELPQLSALLKGGSGEDPISIYVTDPKVFSRQHHLDSGAWRGVCLPWARGTGHYEVTYAAARASGVSAAAVNLLADASQDPDLFEWDNMAAHGQTGDNAGVPAQTTTQAQQAWLEFIGPHLRRARELCGKQPSSAQIRRALYEVGYAMHAIEDVAPHRGRTNPEHAFNADEGKSPDREKTAIQLAEAMATSFLKALLQGSLQPCAEPFAHYSGSGWSLPEKMSSFPFAKQLQLTPGAIRKYHQSAEQFAAVQSRPDASIRWFGAPAPAPATCSGDCDALLQRAVHAGD